MSSDLQVVFIYDTLSCRKEEDDPKEAILYFYPSDVAEDKRIALCGQLMGITHFLTDSFSVPQVVTLENIKFVLRKFDNQYVLALGCSNKTSDWLIQNQADTLHSLTRFFHRDLQTILHQGNGDRRYLCKKLTVMMDHYIPLSQQQGDVFALTFGILPVLSLPKDFSHISIQGTNLLQMCMNMGGILGGIIMYQNQVVCVELCQDVAQKLAFIQPHELPPAECTKVDFKIPTGVHLFNVYVSEHDMRLVKRRASTFHHSNPNGSPGISRDENISDVSSSIGFSEVSSFSLEEDAHHSHDENTESSSEAEMQTFASDRTVFERRGMVEHVPTNSKEDSVQNKQSGSHKSFSYSDLMELNGEAVAKLRSANSAPHFHSRSTCNNKSIKTVPPVVRPEMRSHNLVDNVSGGSSAENSGSHSGLGPQTEKTIDISSVMHMRMMNSFRKLSSHEDLSSCQSSSENERLCSDPSDSIAKSYSRSLSGNKHEKLFRTTLYKPRKEVSYEKCVLCICQCRSMRLLLLIDKDQQLHLKLIETLNEYARTHLLDLEALISNSQTPEEDLAVGLHNQNDPYCYLRYEPIWKSLAHSGKNNLMNVNVIQLMHKDFATFPDMSELIIREDDHVVYGYQCVGSEVYYQQSASLVAGLPMPSDLMGKVPLRAKKRLERDHQIILL